MAEKYYITTPIYYPSNRLHIGNAYTTVAADAAARFKRLLGYDVFFLTGTDEHGVKIDRKAREEGITPKEYVDEIVAWIKDLWDVLEISYDDFIRTTDERHERVAQAIFDRLRRQGDIYKGTYEGWYCTPCESFWPERQLVEGNCPDCGRPVEWVQEEAYFFRMQKYADRLIKYIEEHPDFIQPPSRKNEMLNNFLKPGLEDLCVSRTSFDWGIPVKGDENHVIYVWVDALTNYITALGYPDGERFKRYWPADVHLVGKEIVRFHTITWPIILMALDLPLPKRVFGHGWLVLDSGKISKSKGNVVDPIYLSNKYGVDAVRYFLLREIPFGADGTFSEQALIARVNQDLANDLGNLLSRTVAMIEKWFDGRLPEPGEEGPGDKELVRLVLETPNKMARFIDELQFSNALQALWELVGATNRYIDLNEPWALARTEGKRDRLGTVLYNLAESLRFTAILIAPFLPTTPPKMYEQLGIENGSELTTWESLEVFGKLVPGTRVEKKEAIFPRIDVDTLNDEKQPVKEGGQDNMEEITIHDFSKLKLRVAEVITAERVKNADKLVRLEVSLGDEKRQIVAGIAGKYSPEELVGKKIVMVANLKPARIRGVESNGMLLAASNEEETSILTVDRDIPAGTLIK